MLVKIRDEDWFKQVWDDKRRQNMKLQCYNHIHESFGVEPYNYQKHGAKIRSSSRKLNIETGTSIRAVVRSIYNRKWSRV